MKDGQMADVYKNKFKIKNFKGQEVEKKLEK